MYSYRKQSGFSFSSLSVWFIFGGLGLMLLMKLGPVYMENYTIQSVMRQLNERPISSSTSSGQLRSWFGKGLQVNGIKKLEFDTFDISKEGGHFIINIEYEVRQHLLANIDFVLSFVNTEKLPFH